jgi:hypothetical protein
VRRSGSRGEVECSRAATLGRSRQAACGGPGVERGRERWSAIGIFFRDLMVRTRLNFRNIFLDTRLTPKIFLHAGGFFFSMVKMASKVDFYQL